MRQVRWERWAAILLCLSFAAVAVWLGFRYLFPLLLPFLAAWLIAIPVRALAKRVSAVTGLSQKLCASVLLLLVWGVASLLVGLAISRLLSELQHLIERFFAKGGAEEFLHSTSDYFETLTSRIGFLQKLGAGERFSAFRERFNRMIGTLLSGVLSSLAEALPGFAASFLSSLPSILLAALVTVVSGFYFCTDGEQVSSAICSVLPVPWRERLPSLRNRARLALGRFAHAYLWLLVLTFFELLLGFLLLRVEYAFLLALLVAFVDLLPVLGVGTVLIPWAAVSLLQKDLRMGLGLLILYGAVTVLRQILEPRLVGKSLGLHPLLALFASWVGWRLFGLLGMLLAPFAALIIKAILKTAKQEG